MRIGIVAGEVSGDLLGAGLMHEIKKLYPNVVFEGIAGDLMQIEGCEAWYNSETLSVMGLFEPITQLPKLLLIRKKIYLKWLKNPPDIFIGVDSPDFNLTLEKKLRDKGIPTVHYASPSVWAWRQRRVKKIKKAVNKMLCFFPFEEEFYNKHNVPALFIGHPLADTLPENLDKKIERRKLGIDSSKLIAIMPGSRIDEVSRLGLIFAETAKILAKKYKSISFVSPMVSEKIKSKFEKQLKSCGIRDSFKLLDGKAMQAIAASDAVLLASGTATLEVALLGKPMVAAYRVSFLTYFFLRVFKMIKINCVTLPNILIKKSIIPEFIQNSVNPKILSESVNNFLVDPSKSNKMKKEFDGLRDLLKQGANKKAALAISRLIESKNLR